MDRDNSSLEARKALNDFKLEVADEEIALNDLEASEKTALNDLGVHEDTVVENESLYDLRFNLTPSDFVTKQGLKTRERSPKNPNYSFKDFLGKGF